MDCSDARHRPPVDYRRQRREALDGAFVSSKAGFDESAVQARVGANIRARREQVGLSQTALAERAGIHRTFLNQVENGRGCTVTVLARLAVELGTSPAALVKGIL